MALNKFDISSIRDSSIVFIIGKKYTGKTTLIKNLLKLKNIDDYYVFNKSKEEYNIKNVYAEFKGEYLDNILNIRRNYIRDKNLTKELCKEQYVVIDDSIFSRTELESKSLYYTFMNGRCIKLGAIISMQYPLKIQERMLHNIDYLFILRDTNTNNVKRIYDNYLYKFTSYEAFLDIYNKFISQNPNFANLVIDFTKWSGKFEDIVYYYEVE